MQKLSANFGGEGEGVAGERGVEEKCSSDEEGAGRVIEQVRAGKWWFGLVEHGEEARIKSVFNALTNKRSG